jgi:hypothetical protein
VGLDAGIVFRDVEDRSRERRVKMPDDAERRPVIEDCEQQQRPGARASWRDEDLPAGSGVMERPEPGAVELRPSSVADA